MGALARAAPVGVYEAALGGDWESVMSAGERLASKAAGVMAMRIMARLVTPSRTPRLRPFASIARNSR